MKKFEEQKFDIEELKGISSKNIEEHLKLYSGYVKNSNKIIEQLGTETDAYVRGELSRRFAFEFNGMRNHEYYFSSLAGGAQPTSDTSELKKAIEDGFGSFDQWLESFKGLAKTRGVGWAVLGYDQETSQLVHIWIDEQHLGQLNGVKWILGIDMWEHAFVYDYPTSEKANYIDAFFQNLNWSAIEENFQKATK